MAKETILVPDIGGAEDAEVIEVLVAVGDEISLEQGLIVLESDKASMEIPASVAGKVVELLIKEGDTLAEGAGVCVVEVEGEAEGDAKASSESSAAAPEPETAAEPEAAPPEPASTAGPMDVHVPDIGTDDAVEIIELCVAVGDEIAEGDSLVVLESDKASMEVPSPAGGKVLELKVSEGGQVKQGDLLLVLEAVSTSAPAAPEQVSEAPAPAAPAPTKPAAATAPASAPTASQSGDVHAGPAVRKLARELGVDLGKVSGSGPKGRILKEDLHGYVQNALSKDSSGVSGGAGIPAVPAVDFSQFGPVEIEPMTRMDKATAANMQTAWLNVPHVTQFDDADITELERFRKEMKAEAERRGVKLTPMPFLLKACAAALKAHSRFNCSIGADGESIVYKQYVHIGMAVDTPAGLLVPVIRDVDKKGLWELSEEVVELAGKARDRKLKPDEMKGGCFSISSLGNIGGRGFTPIVNAPEVAILGVSRAEVRPVWDGQAFQPKTMLPLSLSYDHRVINGAVAGRFFTDLNALLGDIRRLLL